jgi:endonuclease/exonuclease/phosphatase family metal-dependent hydrolase
LHRAFRPTLRAQESASARVRYADGVLTVVSWNVLASAYVRPEFYPHTPVPVLEPEGRSARVVERVVGLGAAADVICLQEIEPATFAGVAGRLLGFEGSFAQKRGKPDGCAIFVRRSLGEPAFRELVYSDGTGHVAVAAVVGGVGFASTHLKWEAPEVPVELRLGRAELTELLDAWVAPEEPWVVCGDLNANAASAVLEVAFARGLHDGYASLPEAWTCNSNDRAKRIDFILHTPGFEARPSPLPAITDVTPLPSASEPSDHLAIQVALAARA